MKEFNYIKAKTKTKILTKNTVTDYSKEVNSYVKEELKHSVVAVECKQF